MLSDLERNAMKINVDTHKCSGHARCFDAAAEVFDLDDSGYALPVTEEFDEIPNEVRAAVAACPERAITVE